MCALTELTNERLAARGVGGRARRELRKAIAHGKMRDRLGLVHQLLRAKPLNHQQVTVDREAQDGRIAEHRGEGQVGVAEQVFQGCGVFSGSEPTQRSRARARGAASGSGGK